MHSINEFFFINKYQELLSEHIMPPPYVRPKKTRRLAHIDLELSDGSENDSYDSENDSEGSLVDFLVNSEAEESNYENSEEELNLELESDAFELELSEESQGESELAQDEPTQEVTKRLRKRKVKITKYLKIMFLRIIIFYIT